MAQCRHCKKIITLVAHKVYVSSGSYYYLCVSCHEEMKKDDKDYQLILRGYMK